MTWTHLVIKPCSVTADFIYHTFKDCLFFTPFYNKKKKNTQKTTTNLNSLSVNPELQMANSLHFCKGFCDQLRKKEESRRGKKTKKQTNKPKETTTRRSVKNHQSAAAIILESLWVIRIESVNKEAVVQEREQMKESFHASSQWYCHTGGKNETKKLQNLKIKDS